MDGVSCSIIVRVSRIVPGSITGRSCEWIAVAFSREIVPVCVVGHSADMALNISTTVSIVSIHIDCTCVDGIQVDGPRRRSIEGRC